MPGWTWLLLGLWQGEAAAGWYGAAYRLWEAVGLLPASLLDACFPSFRAWPTAPMDARACAACSASQPGDLCWRQPAAGGWRRAGGGPADLPGLRRREANMRPAVLPFRLLVGAVPGHVPLPAERPHPLCPGQAAAGDGDHGVAVRGSTWP